MLEIIAFKGDYPKRKRTIGMLIQIPSNTKAGFISATKQALHRC
jgi:hypothetical protein